jgi:hypothetical protein
MNQKKTKCGIESERDPQASERSIQQKKKSALLLKVLEEKPALQNCAVKKV